MIKSFLKGLKEKKADREWNKSKVGQTLAIHTDEYFTKYPRLSSWSEESKNKIINDFYNNVFSIFNSENPFLKMRELLAESVLGFAEFQVICLTEEEKLETFYSECRYISGCLHHKIEKIAPHNSALDECKWKFPETTAEQLISLCNTKCLIYLYYSNGFNYLRREFNDIDLDKDWLQPFMKSMLIYQEEEIRKKIDMESLLEGVMDGLKHYTFLELVVQGSKNPYFEWEKTWTPESA